MKYVLSTETPNAYGMVVLTEGIRIPDNNIPILLNHDPDKVLGKWTNFQKVDGKLYAEPIWDEVDEDTQKVIRKIEEGFIDGISVGLAVLKIELPDDEDTIYVTESKLVEASITPIPANEDARIEKEEEKEEILAEVTLSYDGTNDMAVIREKVLKLASKYKETKKVENTVWHNANKENKTVDEPKKEEVEKSEKPKKEKVEESKPKHKKSVKNEAIDDIIKLMNVPSIEEALVKLYENYTELEDKYIKLKEAEKDREIKLYLEAKLNEGRINEQQFDNFLKMAKVDFDAVKAVIEAMPVLPKEKVIDRIKFNARTDADKDWEWYSKHNPQELIRIKTEDPELYKELVNKYIAKKK